MDSAGLWPPPQDAGHPAQAPGDGRAPAPPADAHAGPVARLPGALPAGPGVPGGAGGLRGRLHLRTVRRAGPGARHPETREGGEPALS